MNRMLCVGTIVVLIAGSFAFTANADDGTCASQPEQEPWQEPRPLTDERFSSLFPELDLVVTKDRSRLPEIPRLWAGTPQGYCPLDLPRLVEERTGALSSQADFEQAAWVAALTADTEVLGVVQWDRLVSFEWTGPQEARVVLDALSPATGSEVRWTVDVHSDGRADAQWTVLRLVPEIRSDLGGWFIGPGDTGPFEDPPGAANEEVALYETHDGKQVRITYFLDRYDSVEEAEEDADRNGAGGVLAYDLMNDVWDFPSADPDGFLDITVSGCACIFGGDQVDIFMPPNVMEWVNQLGFSYTDPDEVAYLIIAHEFFHHFQWSTMNWNQASWVVEGTARFIETILWPSQAHQPGSIQYASGANGFPWVMENPDFRPQQHSYSYGLVWGHIYDQNGGVEFFKQLFEESAADPSFPGFIDRALETMGEEHASFGDALVDIGPRMATRSFEWETWDGSESYDWGEFLPDVETETPSSIVGGRWDTNVEEFAMKFLEIPSMGGPAGATLITANGAEAIRNLVVTQSGGAMTSEEFTGTYLGAPDPFDARHLFLVHDTNAGSSNPPPGSPQYSAIVASV